MYAIRSYYVAQAKNAQIAPYQVHRHRQQRVAEVFTQQCHSIGAHIQQVIRRQQEVAQGNEHGNPQYAAQQAQTDLA